VAAAEPLCPHEQARLADGTIQGDAVDCPKHHYMFDLRSGENLYPWRVYPDWKRKEVGDLSLTVYACREEDGWIVVETP
jgi:nitrite reductase/ring-hydroxylating ferredoxin subunit